jgi:hypothetical protein
MKDIFNLANKTLKPDRQQDYFDIFLIKKKKISSINRFTHCRGFVYDELQWKNGKYRGLSNKYFYLYFLGKTTIYRKTPMLSLKAVDMMAQAIQMMGCYKPPEVYQGENGKLLVKMDIDILKNLYAFSIIFSVVKQVGVASLAKKKILSFDAMIADSEMYDHKKTLLFLSNWNKLFPNKFGWRTIYGSTRGLHGQGFGELIRARTVWAELNDAAWSLLERKSKRPESNTTEDSMGPL